MVARSRISVTRRHPVTNEVATYASVETAHRMLAGTATEVRWPELRAMRAALRAGQRDIRDSRGYLWSAINVVAAPVAAAVARVWSELTFGVEIECVAPSQSAIDLFWGQMESEGIAGWRGTHDGSIRVTEAGQRGIEFVSPILKGEEGIATLTKVCAIISELGFSVNRSCGVHVHVGARSLSNAELCRVASAFARNEAHFDALVPRSRRGDNNHYCGSVAARAALIPVAARSVGSIARALNGGYEPNRHYTSFRYRKLNFQPYARLGTIEFRQHSASTDGRKISNWVRLVTGFVAAAANSKLVAETNFDQFLAATVSTETANWLSERAQDLANN